MQSVSANVRNFLLLMTQAGYYQTSLILIKEPFVQVLRSANTITAQEGIHHLLSHLDLGGFHR